MAAFTETTLVPPDATALGGSELVPFWDSHPTIGTGVNVISGKATFGLDCANTKNRDRNIAERTNKPVLAMGRILRSSLIYNLPQSSVTLIPFGGWTIHAGGFIVGMSEEPQPLAPPSEAPCPTHDDQAVMNGLPDLSLFQE